MKTLRIIRGLLKSITTLTTYAAVAAVIIILFTRAAYMTSFTTGDVAVVVSFAAVIGLLSVARYIVNDVYNALKHMNAMPKRAARPAPTTPTTPTRPSAPQRPIYVGNVAYSVDEYRAA